MDPYYTRLYSLTRDELPAEGDASIFFLRLRCSDVISQVWERYGPAIGEHPWLAGIV